MYVLNLEITMLSFLPFWLMARGELWTRGVNQKFESFVSVNQIQSFKLSNITKIIFYKIAQVYKA